jgi:hypothetical protein
MATPRERALLYWNNDWLAFLHDKEFDSPRSVSHAWVPDKVIARWPHLNRRGQPSSMTADAITIDEVEKIVI